MGVAIIMAGAHDLGFTVHMGRKSLYLHCVHRFASAYVFAYTR